MRSGSISRRSAAERRAQQQPAGGRHAGPSAPPREPRRRPRCAVPSIVFSATLPVKPSVTTTSAVAGQQVAALDVADEVDAVGLRRGLAWASTTSVGALLRLLADREQATRGLLDAEHRAR